MTNAKAPLGKSWHISCSPSQFGQCRKDDRFPYIVALARAINALNSSHSLLLIPGEDSPRQTRNLMNSYLFSSALLYEAILLIRKMNKPFASNEKFQSGLKQLLKDPVAQRIERMHLNPARNHAVFHFLPDEFAEVIKNQKREECRFVQGEGDSRSESYWSYADIVAGEILIGIPTSADAFWPSLGSIAKETAGLLNKFTYEAEFLIGICLLEWGFKRR